MADTPITIADLVKINSMDVAENDISDLLIDAPLIRSLVADTASNGTSHKYTKEASAPVVGFRSANDGRDHDASSDTLVTIDLKILDASFHVDKAVADAYTKGGPDALMGREAKRHLRAAFSVGEKQLLYGTGNESDGFVGLADAATLSATDADKVITPSTSVGGFSSVFAIRSVDEMSDLALITGQDGNLEIGDRYEQMVEGTNGKFPAYCQSITGWMGLQLGSVHSVARLANLGKDTGQLDDDLIAQLLALFPSSRPATALVMNRRSLSQLQQSRTATNATGAPAPFPTEAFNVPIILTDSVSNSETQLTAA
ncbi:major capsid protein [Rhodopirellula baltica]